MKLEGWIIVTKDCEVVPGSFRADVDDAITAARERLRLEGKPWTTLFASPATLDVAHIRFPMVNGETLRN